MSGDRIDVGDRVWTPIGPGVVRAIHKDRGLKGLFDRPMFVVDLDDQGHCSYFRYDHLALEEHSSRAENQAEALAIERHQEAKHRDRQD